MEYNYTSEENVQMLVCLMKAHGIKKIIASPGTTNITFVASVQQDDFFEVISCADERSAAYMACGIAAESGEAVALSCTGATASRNYISGLTEAYYRKLPILAITSTQHSGRIGQLQAQVIDRSVIQNDIAVEKVDIPLIHSEEDSWDCNIKINKALLALKHKGGGPVHINLWTDYSRDFNISKLPSYRVIDRITDLDSLPVIQHKRVGIFVGAHCKWDVNLTKNVEEFCEKYNACVLCDHTSNYHGKYAVQYNLVSAQSHHFFDTTKMDLLIDIGEMSGAYMWIDPAEVWRISEDGEIRDRYKKLTKVFEMKESTFFATYNKLSNDNNTEYYIECKTNYENVKKNIPELPFSNAWIAKNTCGKLPKNSVLHLGILNSLRNWNFFEKDESIDCFTNTGGFGIDGAVSTFVGGALAQREKIHYLVVGDLAFFYDLNGIANKNINNNIRIIMINNGCGTEFKNYSHFAAQFKSDGDEYIAARGHYGNKSSQLVKNYCENLGFDYYSASNKEEYLEIINEICNPEDRPKPLLVEVFTNSEDESQALYLIDHIIVDEPSNKEKVKNIAKGVLGDGGVQLVKKIIKR